MRRTPQNASQLRNLPAQNYGSGVFAGRIETLENLGNHTNDTFAYPLGATPGTGFTSEGAATELSPASAIVARDLFVKEDHVSANSVGTRNYILRVNGQDSALRCSTTASSTNPTGTIQCSDTTHAVTIPARSTICLSAEQKYYTGGGVNNVVQVRFGWRAASS